MQYNKLPDEIYNLRYYFIIKSLQNVGKIGIFVTSHFFLPLLKQGFHKRTHEFLLNSLLFAFIIETFFEFIMVNNNGCNPFHTDD